MCLYMGDWGGRITWGQELKAEVSHDYTTAVQPGQQSKTLSKKKKVEELDKGFPTDCVTFICHFKIAYSVHKIKFYQISVQGL